RRWNVDPPVSWVTAFEGVPGFAGVLRVGFADTPPHGAIFCGSPSRFCTSEAAGETRTKCASATPDRLATATTTSKILLLIGNPPWTRTRRSHHHKRLRIQGSITRSTFVLAVWTAVFVLVRATARSFR